MPREGKGKTAVDWGEKGGGCSTTEGADRCSNISSSKTVRGERDASWQRGLGEGKGEGGSAARRVGRNGAIDLRSIRMRGRKKGQLSEKSLQNQQEVGDKRV